MRAFRSRRPGSANSSIRSARRGRRSYSRASTANRANSTTGQNFTYSSVYGLEHRLQRQPDQLLQRREQRFGRARHARRRAGISLSLRLVLDARANRSSNRSRSSSSRPNEVLPKLQPNEDAQSLVFDETNLFAWDKYSGYDRIEGGTRLNYGMQYTANFANGGHANFVGGESDPARGAEFLHDRRRRQHRPANPGSTRNIRISSPARRSRRSRSNFSFTSKQQFDSSTFALARLDVIANADVQRLQDAASTMPDTPRSRCWAGYTLARAS